MKVEYKYKKGKMKIEIEDETNTLTKEMISELVSTLQDTSKLTSDEIIAKIQAILNVQDFSNVKFEIEYLNGHDFEIDKEYKNHDENVQDDEDEQQKIEDEDHHEDEQQKSEDDDKQEQ